MSDTALSPPPPAAADAGDWRTWRVGLRDGAALVLRHEGAILVARPEGPAQERFYDEIASVVGAPADPAGSAGYRIARRVAALVAQAEPADVPDVAVLAAAADGLVVLLVGAAVLEVVDEQGDRETVTSRDAATWVDRVVRDPYRQVSIHVGTPGLLHARSDLREGTVRAAGIVLQPGQAPAVQVPAVQAPAVQAPAASAGHLRPDEAGPATAVADVLPAVRDAPLAVATDPPHAALTPRPDFVAVSLTPDASPAACAGAPSAGLPRVPEPQVTAQPPGPGTEQIATAQVEGILCSRAHFNDPRSAFCASCGISMVQQTHNLVTGPRPTLGVLVVDDGTVLTLDADYVVGRDPEVAHDVITGSARPLELDDPAQTMSRVHARILRRGWDVVLVDAGSANGTFVAPAGEGGWTRLRQEEPTVVSSGTRFQVGGRSIVFDSHRTA